MNDIEENCCKYEDKEAGMPKFMDDNSSVGDVEEIRKEIRNCRKIETLKKFQYGLKKIKFWLQEQGSKTNIGNSTAGCSAVHRQV